VGPGWLCRPLRASLITLTTFLAIRPGFWGTENSLLGVDKNSLRRTADRLTEAEAWCGPAETAEHRGPPSQGGGPQ